mgnify:FL=1
MQHQCQVCHYFIGPGLPGEKYLGTEGLFDIQNGWKAYFLAGGTAALKTAFLQKLIENFEEKGPLEIFYDSWNAQIMVGVRFPDQHICVLDGLYFGYTNLCPGFGERIISMDDCLRTEALQEHAAQIILFQARELAARERANRFIKASNALMEDSIQFVTECVDTPKMQTVTNRMAKRLFSKTDQRGSESIRLLDAITSDGMVHFYDETAAQVQHIYVIEDRHNVAPLYLNCLRDAAIQSGQHVISCVSPVSAGSRVEHLLFPDISTAFLTSSQFHTAKGCRHLHMSRFLNKEQMAAKRAWMTFNRRTTRAILKQAVLLFGEAEENRKIMQSFYDKAVNQKALKKVEDQVIEGISV